jgi:subtilisin family serine protease
VKVAGPRHRPLIVKLAASGVAAMVLGSVPSAARAAPADAPGGGLPTIPSTTQASGGCTAPSRAVVKQTPWAQALLDPRPAWALSDGTGVTVAVVDTGVDASHGSPLAGQVVNCPTVAGGSWGRADCVGHGPFVAGLIAARPRNGIGEHRMPPPQ